MPPCTGAKGDHDFFRGSSLDVALDHRRALLLLTNMAPTATATSFLALAGAVSTDNSAIATAAVGTGEPRGRHGRIVREAVPDDDQHAEDTADRAED